MAGQTPSACQPRTRTTCCRTQPVGPPPPMSRERPRRSLPRPRCPTLRGRDQPARASCRTPRSTAVRRRAWRATSAPTSAPGGGVDLDGRRAPSVASRSRPGPTDARSSASGPSTARADRGASRQGGSRTVPLDGDADPLRSGRGRLGPRGATGPSSARGRGARASTSPGPAAAEAARGVGRPGRDRAAGGRRRAARLRRGRRRRALRRRPRRWPARSEFDVPATLRLRPPRPTTPRIEAGLRPGDGAGETPCFARPAVNVIRPPRPARPTAGSRCWRPSTATPGTTWTARCPTTSRSCGSELDRQPHVSRLQVAVDPTPPPRPRDGSTLTWPGGTRDRAPSTATGRRAFPPFVTTQLTSGSTPPSGRAASGFDSARLVRCPSASPSCGSTGCPYLPSPCPRPRPRFPCGAGPALVVNGAPVRTAVQAQLRPICRRRHRAEPSPAVDDHVSLGSGTNLVEASRLRPVPASAVVLTDDRATGCCATTLVATRKTPSTARWTRAQGAAGGRCARTPTRAGCARRLAGPWTRWSSTDGSKAGGSPASTGPVRVVPARTGLPDGVFGVGLMCLLVLLAGGGHGGGCRLWRDTAGARASRPCAAGTGPLAAGLSDWRTPGRMDRPGGRVGGRRARFAQSSAERPRQGPGWWPRCCCRRRWPTRFRPWGGVDGWAGSPGLAGLPRGAWWCSRSAALARRPAATGGRRSFRRMRWPLHEPVEHLRQRPGCRPRSAPTAAEPCPRNSSWSQQRSHAREHHQVDAERAVGDVPEVPQPRQRQRPGVAAAGLGEHACGHDQARDHERRARCLTSDCARRRHEQQDRAAQRGGRDAARVRPPLPSRLPASGPPRPRRTPRPTRSPAAGVRAPLRGRCRP